MQNELSDETENNGYKKWAIGLAGSLAAVVGGAVYYSARENEVTNLTPAARIAKEGNAKEEIIRKLKNMERYADDFTDLLKSRGNGMFDGGMAQIRGPLDKDSQHLKKIREAVENNKPVDEPDVEWFGGYKRLLENLAKDEKSVLLGFGDVLPKSFASGLLERTKEHYQDALRVAELMPHLRPVKSMER